MSSTERAASLLKRYHHVVLADAAITEFGRVLKEVKLPFPDDFFPEMTVSPNLSDDFHRTASRLLQQTLDDELPVTRFHPSQQTDQWKLIGDRNGLQLYRERGFIKGNAIKVNVLGQMKGTLEGVLLALYAPTNEALKTQRAIMHNVYLDAAVLHVLEEDPHSEHDTSFSYRFEGLKWLACAPTGKLRHKRDLCWHEQLGRTQDANGDDVGYLIMQSVRVDECPSFEQQGLTRSTAAVCYIFRPLPNNRVGVFMKGQHAVGGKSRSWSADAIMTELWLGVASALECTKAKWLSKLVSGTEMLIVSAQTKTCDICDSKLKILKTNPNCKICGKSVCNRCRMTKMIYPSRNTDNFPCTYFFCKPCLSDVKEKLYGRSTAWVGFQSEDSSARSGSNRSGSPRYARAQSTGQPVPSTISSSSESTPVQRQRVPSHDRAGPAAMPPIGGTVARPSSRCSSTSSYYSARTTVSSAPSMSLYSSSSMKPGFSANKFRSMRAYQTPTGRSSDRPVENETAAGPPRVQRSTSDSMQRNATPRATGNSHSASQQVFLGDKSLSGSRYMGNQSVDCIYDVGENEPYRGRGFVISDDSDISEESADEEDTEVTSLSRRWRQHMSVHESEDDEIEMNRFSDSGRYSPSEPEPVDVFETDKLKYINPSRSNTTAARSIAGATTSSSRSTEQKTLMERLVQINMAAEATYLMTKYNSNIQGNASR